MKLDKIEGVTPPAPIIKTFLFLKSHSFSSKLILKPSWSVLYPTTLSFSFTKVFTDLVN